MKKPWPGGFLGKEKHFSLFEVPLITSNWPRFLGLTSWDHSFFFFVGLPEFVFTVSELDNQEAGAMRKAEGGDKDLD